MPSITLTKITKEASRVRFRFGKIEREFPSIQAARDWAQSRFTREDMEAIAIALCLSRQPNLTNVNQLEGRTLTVDLSLANWGTVS